MIVRCPECSTGFKLPDEQVTEKGVKLRCSKCSHVFRIRLADDGGTEFFYNDGDREQNEALAAAGQESDEASDSEAKGADAGDGEWTEGESTKLGKPMAASASQDESNEVDTEKANKTQFGMPSSKKEASGDMRKPSKSASSNYNPFPHANLDLKSSKESTLGSDAGADAPAEAAQPAPSEAASSPQEEDLDWGDEATRVEDAFDGAFDEDADEDASETGAQVPVTSQAPTVAQQAQTPPAADPAANAPADSATSAAANPVSTAQAGAVGAQAGAQPAVQTPQNTQPEQDSDFWAQKDSAYNPEDMVDPSFGQDGPAFDPDQGVVDTTPAPNQPAPNQPATSQTAAGPPAGVTASPGQAARSVPVSQPQASQPQASQPQVSQPQASQPQVSQPQVSQPQASQPQASQPQASQPQANVQTTFRRNQSVQNDGGWEVDMIDDPIAPHTVGGSGLQKFANLVLITLIVGVGFLAVVAGLTGGILDLNRFPHMLEVAFEGAEFAPREEWVEKSVPAPAPAPEDPVRFEGVFATPASVSKSDRVILVRGNARNIANVDYSDVIVRGILYDKNERVIAQTSAPLGARVLPSQLAETGSADAAKRLLPENSKLLSRQSAEPFSLIFTNLPPKVFEAQDVIYRVEIADKKSSADEAAAGASN